MKAIPPDGFTHLFGSVIACVPPLIVLFSILFIVRGYELNGTQLLIHRLLWSTVIPLNGIKAVRHDPEAIKCSVRIFGNAGFYSFTGLYQNKTLGQFRLFGTDTANSVVLSSPYRVIVITPEKPPAFIHFLLQYFPNVREESTQKNN
jgi:hypothetical protein